MLPHIIFDPSTFWIASTDDDPNFIESYIVSAISWREFARSESFEFFHSRQAIQRLIDINMFPAADYFEKLFEKAGLIGVLSPRQLATLVARALASIPAIEDTMPVKDCLFDEFECLTLKAISDNKLREISLDNTVLSLASTLVKGVPEDMLFFALSRVGQAKSETLKCVLTFCEPSEHFSRCSKFERKATFLPSPSDAEGAASGNARWRMAEHAEEIRQAIAKKSLDLNGGETSGLKEFTIGSEFIENIKATQSFKDGRYSSVVLERCAQVVCQSQVISVDYLYTSASSGVAVKRLDDKAHARRVHITTGHQALRLMYWELPDGSIEFASVRNKSDTVIDFGKGRR